MFLVTMHRIIHKCYEMHVTVVKKIWPFLTTTIMHNRGYTSSFCACVKAFSGAGTAPLWARYKSQENCPSKPALESKNMSRLWIWTKCSHQRIILVHLLGLHFNTNYSPTKKYIYCICIQHIIWNIKFHYCILLLSLYVSILSWLFAWYYINTD